MKGFLLLRKTFGGFSLLEIMVALLLLAVSFTALILVQGRATALAAQAKNLSIATELARFQLMECKREAKKIISSASDFKEEGDFADLGFPQFKWECHAPKFNMKPPSASKVEENIKNKAGDTIKKDASTTSSVSAPFIAMITDSLGNAVRELVVIVRWTEKNSEDEIRVVTHIIDLVPMSGLARMLSQGAKMLEKTPPKKNPEEAKPQAPLQPPGGQPPPFPPPFPPPGGGLQ
ncbi:MAG TPA: prepilin-type N-terminal cleavage/methylation domain-containing protein [Myxococcota bacterium]|nr:prepilin-type N-terminal cleavage/methylation domain-containing protein [Myxococcota bacterium]